MDLIFPNILQDVCDIVPSGSGTFWGKIPRQARVFHKTQKPITLMINRPLATMASLLDSEDEESWHWPRSQIARAGKTQVR
jgi:hypothetical protein